MGKLKRHVEDQHGIEKAAPPPTPKHTGHGRSRTAGETDFDETEVSKNQGHGHPREERRSGREEP